MGVTYFETEIMDKKAELWKKGFDVKYLFLDKLGRVMIWFLVREQAGKAIAKNIVMFNGLKIIVTDDWLERNFMLGWDDNG